MTDVVNTRQPAGAKQGVELHRYSRSEYAGVLACRAVQPSDPVQLIDGLLALRTDATPPYPIPVGIPPEILWEGQRLLDRRPLRKLTVPEFERIVEAGILPGIRFELADGWVVDKMSRSPKHDNTLQRLYDALRGVLPSRLILRNQASLTLDESVYEPDLAVVPGPVHRYDRRHPLATEALLVVEVAQATLRFDRSIKLQSYARNGIETYWIINLVKDCVEIYTDPSGPTPQPEYRDHVKLIRGQKLTLQRGKLKLLEIAVSDILAR